MRVPNLKQWCKQVVDSGRISVTGQDWSFLIFSKRRNTMMSMTKKNADGETNWNEDPKRCIVNNGKHNGDSDLKKCEDSINRYQSNRTRYKYHNLEGTQLKLRTTQFWKQTERLITYPGLKVLFWTKAKKNVHWKAKGAVWFTISRRFCPSTNFYPTLVYTHELLAIINRC